VDTVSRYGGEEFALLLPETTGPGAKAVAERLRAAVAAEPIAVGEGVSLAITVSVGVAVFPADAADEGSLLAAADRALYAAKQWGRNRVVEAAAVDATRGGARAVEEPPPARDGTTGGDPAA
jgi:diguanylate cyclase (GGDEF)-like protein